MTNKELYELIEPHLKEIYKLLPCPINGAFIYETENNPIEVIQVQKYQASFPQCLPHERTIVLLKKALKDCEDKVKNKETKND